MCSKNHPIKILKANSNGISGGDSEFLTEQLMDNFNIASLEIENNDVSQDSGNKLLTLVKNSYFCEQLKLKGNKRIDYEIIEAIEDECRKNYLIKHHIASGMKNFDKDINVQTNFLRKQIKKVKIQEKEFYQSDFIGKFISLNRSSLQVVHFLKVNFVNGLNELLENIKGEHLNLKTIIFESCKLGPQLLQNVTTAICGFISLEELHLIDMGIGRGIKIKDPKKMLRDNLKVLNLKNNGITDFKEIQDIIINSRSLKTIDLRGNFLESKSQFDEMIKGISRNISVSRIYFDLDKEHKIDEDRINAFYEEIKKNEYIDRLIEWKNFNQYYLNQQTDLNLSGTKNLGKNIDAVIKLYRCLHNKTELVLANCNLEDDII